MIAVFTITFLWRYFRKLTTAQVVSFGLVGVLMLLVAAKVSQNEESSVYTKAAYTTQEELWGRLEGGLSETVAQAGIMGAGLGTATQGVYHVLRTDTSTTLGWQEGGLGKLAIELGVPGLLAIAVLGVIMLLTMLKISAHPDVAGSSQLARAALFAIIAANVVEFIVSAQAYSDPVLTLLTAFFVGCMFATAALDERLAEAEAAVKETTGPRKTPLTSAATA
jgi:hypothetical protein